MNIRGLGIFSLYAILSSVPALSLEVRYRRPSKSAVFAFKKLEAQVREKDPCIHMEEEGRDDNFETLSGDSDDLCDESLQRGKAIGEGAYATVYNIEGHPDQILKVFRSKDAHEAAQKECSWGKGTHARDPEHFVDCSCSADHADGVVAVFGRAPGRTLFDAADQKGPSGFSIETIQQALDVLDQLSTSLINMMEVGKDGKSYFHFDLHPQNIMVDGQGSDGVKLTIIDYGMVEECPCGGKDAISKAHVYRWLGLNFLWVLASNQFDTQKHIGFTQLPALQKHFFDPSMSRPGGFKTSALRKEGGAPYIASAIGKDIFEKVINPAFRGKAWRDAAVAQQSFAKLLGEVLWGVAQASDNDEDFTPDFLSFRQQIRALKGLVAGSAASAKVTPAKQQAQGNAETDVPVKQHSNKNDNGRRKNRNKANGKAAPVKQQAPKPSYDDMMFDPP